MLRRAAVAARPRRRTRADRTFQAAWCSQDAQGRGSVDQALAFIRRRFDVDAAEARVAELAQQLQDGSVWSSPKHAARLASEHGMLTRRISRVQRLSASLHEARELLAMAREEGDEAAAAEEEATLAWCAREAQTMRMEVLLGGREDARDCYVEVQAGAGGRESCDWAEMLMHMYTRAAVAHGWSVREVSRQEPEGGGVRSACLLVAGECAHGWLAAEAGTHRLVRVSPFDAQNRRHTSFARVAVLPVPADDGDGVDVAPSDLRVDTFRASGAGGQHVNTTDSAVRVTYLPTGTVASCQSSRSQHGNREAAMALLRAKLAAVEAAARAEARQQATAALGANAWGEQIRSYILHPYQLVKDHRTGVEAADVRGVLDGGIGAFLNAGLEWRCGDEGSGDSP